MPGAACLSIDFPISQKPKKILEAYLEAFLKD
jgi:hypothetical protein